MLPLDSSKKARGPLIKSHKSKKGPGLPIRGLNLKPRAQSAPSSVRRRTKSCQWPRVWLQDELAEHYWAELLAEH